MKLPPPPPSERRFFQFFTAKGERAVKEGGGPLYDLLVGTLFEMNPSCFDDESEVKVLLPKMLWPPQNLEQIFSDFVHIPKIATHLRVDPDGEWTEVFESDLSRYFHILAARTATKVAFVKQFGNVSKFRHAKAEAIAEGASEAEINEFWRTFLEGSERRLRRPWWKFW